MAESRFIECPISAAKGTVGRRGVVVTTYPSGRVTAAEHPSGRELVVVNWRARFEKLFGDDINNSEVPNG